MRNWARYEMITNSWPLCGAIWDWCILLCNGASLGVVVQVSFLTWCKTGASFQTWCSGATHSPNLLKLLQLTAVVQLSPFIMEQTWNWCVFLMIHVTDYYDKKEKLNWFWINCLFGRWFGILYLWNNRVMSFICFALLYG